MNGMRVYWYSTALLTASGLLGAAVTLLVKHWREMIQTIQDSIAYIPTHPVETFLLMIIVGICMAIFGLLMTPVEDI